ncbi:MAG: AAA-like domain-containing protein [Candidatus Competibacteraceae bacterium]|nr:AAA-like domain-containing protein [Candidatus Competibacteraceae bacterium]
MRFFNTEGPNVAEDHYCLPPLARWDLDAILTLIDQKKYFLLHAPRQTGKTTCLLALADYLNREGRYRAVYANIEPAQAARERVEVGMAAVVQAIANSARWLLQDEDAQSLARQALQEQANLVELEAFLSQWCAQSPLPIVLILDKVDALIGDTLISLLRQLRAGYSKRPSGFPQTVILCGVRDLRDYRIYSSVEQAAITGGSVFNIKAESLRLSDFNAAEVAALLQQHTLETGQVFTPEALGAVWTLTCGQPWLVNALVYESCFRVCEGRDRRQPITAEQIEQAKENLILRRMTHLDQLADRLREAQVRRIIEPMLAGAALDAVFDDDIRYLIDLGLCRMAGDQGLAIANPIYREVLPRMLASTPQASLPPIAPTWLNPDGSLNPDQLLQAFLDFWRQHGQPLLGNAPYHKIAPHLVLMAFLHRVIDGGGTLEREYAIGRGRMDLCLRYGAVTLGMELKMWRDDEPDPLTEGLAQLDGYLAGLRLTRGWLVIFDRRRGQPPIRKRTFSSEMSSPQERQVTMVRA